MTLLATTGPSWGRGCLRWLAAFALPWPMSGSSEVLLVRSSQISAHAQALRGFEQTFGEKVSLLELRNPTTGTPTLHADNGTRLIVAFGSAAAEQALSSPLTAPVLASMVVGTEWIGTPLQKAPVAVVSLEIPLPAVIEQLKRLFPDKRKAGWIHNPARSGPPPAELREAARRLGWTLEVAGATPLDREGMEAKADLWTREFGPLRLVLAGAGILGA